MRLTGPLESAALLTVLPGAGARRPGHARRAALGAARRAGCSAAIAAGVGVPRRALVSPLPAPSWPSAVLARAHPRPAPGRAGRHRRRARPAPRPRAGAGGDAPGRRRAFRRRHARAHPPAAGPPRRGPAAATAAGCRLDGGRGRTAGAWRATGLPGVRMAEGSSLGRAVAGTVSGAWFAGCLLVAAGSRRARLARGRAVAGQRLAICRSPAWPPACSPPRCSGGAPRRGSAG